MKVRERRRKRLLVYLRPHPVCTTAWSLSGERVCFEARRELMIGLQRLVVEKVSVNLFRKDSIFLEKRKKKNRLGTRVNQSSKQRQSHLSGLLRNRSISRMVVSPR